MSAERELSTVWAQFVDSVSHEVLAQLLEDLVSDGVLNNLEKESILEENQSRARCVIDTVLEKGDEACRTMIRHLQTIDPLLSSELGLSSGPSSLLELSMVRRELADMVSHEVLAQLLEDLVSHGLLNNLEKESILEENQSKGDEARCVIDTVLEKGEEACRTMIRHLQILDPLLSYKLGFSSGPAYRSALATVRAQLMCRISNEVLAQLLEALVSDDVLNNAEKESMLFKNQTRANKARRVIDTVMKKGDGACGIMIRHLQTIDPFLSFKLGLFSAPSSSSGFHVELAAVRAQFVDLVSHEVLAQLLKALVSDGVLNNMEKELILEENQTKADKERRVINTIMEKGETACRIMIRHLKTIDPLLSSKLGLSSGPSSRSGGSQVKLDPNASKTRLMKPPSCFTPEVQTECEQISYRFNFPGSGLFQCSLTGLVFDMTQEAKLLYRVIQWDESTLTPTRKTPAGPLFDIKGPEEAVCWLHFPHCETKQALRSGNLLSVIHFSDDGMSILKPLMITDTHVIVEVPHLSAFGLARNIVKSLWNTRIRSQILLFLRQPKAGPRREYVDMLLLPRNVPLQEVKAQHSNSDYIRVASNCKLIKDETYTVHCPTAMKIQPSNAKFDMEFGPNYHVTFVINFALDAEEVAITVQDQRGKEVWKHDVDLTAVPRSSLVCSSNQQELHRSASSLESAAADSTGPLQRNDPLKDGKNHLLSILQDLNDDDFKDFKWRLKSESWNNIEAIKEDQLSKAERREVVDLMVQTYETTGAVRVMERTLEKIPRKDLVKKLRAELCAKSRSSSSV